MPKYPVILSRVYNNVNAGIQKQALSAACTMNTLRSLCCLCLIFLTLTNGVLLSTCGFSNVTDILHTEENGFVNVSYPMNVTEHFNSSLPFVAHVQVCAMNSLIYVCKYYWEKQSNRMTAKSEHSGTFCSALQRDPSSSTFTFDLQISQVFNRSLSLMILSLRDHTDSKKSFKEVGFIKLEVLDPPTVTSLSVDGQEVNGSCLINESQEVNITCSFDKGNPPATFRLLVQNGTELKRSDNNGHIVHLMTALCTDDWPIVRCEGNGSKQNRSVLFLVRCPPQFVNNSKTVFSPPETDVITLPVKSHTTPGSGCLLTSMSSGNNTEVNVTCSITGNPPDFLLNLHLGQVNSRIHGNWTLTVHNDEGSGNITLAIFSPITNSASVPERVLPIIKVVLGCGSALILAAVAVVAIYVIKKAKEKKHAMILNDVYETSGGLVQVPNTTQENRNCTSLSNQPPLPPPRNPQTASEVPLRPTRSENTLSSVNAEDHGSHSQTYVSAADVRKQKKTKRTGNLSSGADKNAYVSAPEVREKKRRRKQGRAQDRQCDTYVLPSDVRKGRRRRREDRCIEPCATERTDSVRAALTMVIKINQTGALIQVKRRHRLTTVSGPYPSSGTNTKTRRQEQRTKTRHLAVRNAVIFSRRRTSWTAFLTANAWFSFFVLVFVFSCLYLTKGGMPSTSGHRNAEGLVYGDLDFTDKKRRDVIHDAASKTEYAHINATAVAPPPRDYQKKTGRKEKMDRRAH